MSESGIAVTADAVASWIQHHVRAPRPLRALERFAEATPFALRLHVGFALLWAALAGLLFVPALQFARDGLVYAILGIEAPAGALLGPGLVPRLAPGLLVRAARLPL